MKKTKETTGQAKHDRKRREFLKKSTLLGAGVAATSTAPAVALANAVEPTPDTEQQKGYHVTQHIIDYYKSAAI